VRQSRLLPAKPSRLIHRALPSANQANSYG
jgi:hypothetical protein